MGKALGLLAGVALVAGPAHAETLGEVLAAQRVGPPPSRLVLDQPLETYQVLDDDRDLLVVYVGQPAVVARLQAARFKRATRRWTVPRLDWTVSGASRGLRALATTVYLSSLALCQLPPHTILPSRAHPSA